ncbi:nuclear transcription factor Y subunit A-6-like isoform X2 [Punica granatum]|uniref:Nuclear transcription factor Y subunit n=3 Tax=Punica granatum TaxID=22663 RepID=A0A6P8DRD3_PUNGR|nr:nuclear transcription factor Y subunit A-6-like isoform X2 [Punica granatum]
MMDPYSVSCEMSIGNSTISQGEQSKNLSLKTGIVPLQTSCNYKQTMTSQFQDQESSSTQSTGQSYSYPEMHQNDELNRSGQAAVSVQTECNASDQKSMEGQVDSAVSVISQETLFSLPQLDSRQSLVCPPLHNAELYFSGLMANYGPHQTMVLHPNLMGMGHPRVPLSFDPMKNEPIYVNPKQYHAILRRRQHRAKLKAQSKLSKDRKPYLHESRHLHAIRRLRGSGGQFLSTKKHQEESSQPASTIGGSKSRDSQTSVNRDVGSTRSCSDVTAEYIFPNSNSRFPGYVSGSSANGHKWLL